MLEKEILENEIAELHTKKEGLETDKKNIENLLDTVTKVLCSRQKAIDEINSKPAPQIILSASIGTVDLYCKKCKAHLVNLIPKQYLPLTSVCTEEEKERYRLTQKMPAIECEIVSDIPCDRCGCNLIEATIKIAIDNPLKGKK